MRRKSRLSMVEDLYMESLSEFEIDLFEIRNRECVFSPALTMWLFLNQRMSGGVSLVEVLKEYRDGGGHHLFKSRTESRKGKVVSFSINSGGFCKARHRLSLELVRDVTKAISSTVRLRASQDSKWRGRKVYILDGTQIDLPRTTDIESNYPRHRNQHGMNQSPKMLCMFMHDLVTGVAVNPAYGPWRGSKATSEQALSKEILPEAEKGSLIVGDRNLGVFSIAYAAKENEQQVLVRLTTTRAKVLLGDDFGLEKVDKEIVWKATASTLKNNPEIPAGAELIGRVIKHTVREANIEPLELLFFTNSAEPAHALVKLYKKREKIEHDIRSLKCTLAMDMLYGKTDEMVQKELLLGVAAYNLLRGVIAQMAKRVKLTPREISFSRAAMFVQSFGRRIGEAETKLLADKLVKELEVVFTQIRLYKRKRKRIEPRKIVRNKRKFPVMREAREEERKFLINSQSRKFYRGVKTT